MPGRDLQEIRPGRRHRAGQRIHAWHAGHGPLRLHVHSPDRGKRQPLVETEADAHAEGNRGDRAAFPGQEPGRRGQRQLQAADRRPGIDPHLGRQQPCLAVYGVDRPPGAGRPVEMGSDAHGRSRDDGRLPFARLHVREDLQDIDAAGEPGLQDLAKLRAGKPGILPRTLPALRSPACAGMGEHAGEPR